MAFARGGRHGRYLESMTSNQQLDAYLLEEQSCQISSESDLKSLWRASTQQREDEYGISSWSKNRRLTARTIRISLIDCFLFRLTLNIEESSKNKALSRFQVDFKQNRLRSTKPVVEVCKIDSTRLGSLKSTRVDLNRLTPRSSSESSVKKL